MQAQPIAGALQSPVRGLGVCDALELSLLLVQVPWLIDELEELQRPLEEELDRAPRAGGVGWDEAQAERVVEEELRAVRAISEASNIACYVKPGVS
jgi:hypothetical protein